MIKFFKVKDTEVRKVATVDEQGKIVDFKALIGKVSELLKLQIIFPDNTKGNEEKWLVVTKDGSDIREFPSLQEAKESCKGRWE